MATSGGEREERQAWTHDSVCLSLSLSVCVCMYVCFSLSLSVCVLEGDTGVNSQTSPVPLPQKLISSRPNPTKKLGENPIPSHSRVVVFFSAEICQLQ